MRSRPAETGQELHEKIRTLSMEAGRQVKAEGKDNNLLELIAADPAFNLSLEQLKAAMDPSRYVGLRSPAGGRIPAGDGASLLQENEAVLGRSAEINV